MISLKSTGERIIPEFDQEKLGYAEHLSRYFFAGQFVKGKTVLDIACGSGYGSRHLLEKGAKKVFGVDISQEAIDYAKRNYQKKGIRFLQGDAESIPIEDRTIDVVVSFETIEHLKNQEKFLKEIKRVLRKDGLALISTPNTLVYPKGNKFHTEEFTPQEFREFLLKYFKNLKPCYQNNIVSNYILNEKKVASKEIKTKNLNLAKIPPDQNLFLLGIASDNNLPKIKESMTLFGKKVVKQIEELLNIYNSRGWKIICFLHRLRKSLPILRKL